MPLIFGNRGLFESKDFGGYFLRVVGIKWMKDSGGDSRICLQLFAGF